ncbi:HAMP domain-containing histidine kinase [Sphingobacterium sp. SRCM116780]|uniref:sensor histidine kinase n=1 Tax=Sphingobacterium sp. SRCM116780 TaxID=2907623 RepID=UPI001F1FF974|nr:HAMP domain-containing sensor histidine kinase [Sphingobacterium sp. SRCM116780]UIR56027.1 HAMP domain-containing histidine kinase [Sphingobacterium sp. SRCM116780]
MSKIKMIQVVAITSFIILILLQVRLISSVYQIEQLEFLKNEKEGIKLNYEESIVNDKVYPGGQKIIDSILVPHYTELEQLYKKDRKLFDQRLKQLGVKVLLELKNKANFKVQFQQLIRKQKLDLAEYDYALFMDKLALTFDGKTYYSLFTISPKNREGLIEGNFDVVHPQHSVSAITVSLSSPNSNLVGFKLYVNKHNQAKNILMSIAPFLLLAISSILVIVFLFFVTMRNWMRQKKLNEISSDFFNHVTHEFKTPLTTIKVSTKNLRTDLEDNQWTGGYRSFDVINRQVQRLDKLINQALEVSSFDPQAAQFAKHFLITDLYNILLDLQVKWKNQAVISFRFDDNITTHCAYYDHFMLTTLITNLVENGLKHNVQEQKKVAVLVMQNSDKFLEIEIHDNGHGIKKSDRKRIYKKFQRGEQMTSTTGLGLGLYFVHKIIEVHKWKLNLESEIDKGTIFKITIPILK